MLFADNTLLGGVSFDDYVQADGINASGLKTIMRSPAHFYHERYVAKRKETPALRFGQLVHLAILEPERFATDLAVSPDYNLRTNVGKEDMAKWRANLPLEAIVANQAEADQLKDMVAATQSHRVLRRLLEHGRREATLFWQDEKYGVRAKCRYDFVADKTMVIVDLKTCQDARPEPFARDAYKYDYFLSCAHYLEGARVTGVANPEKFVFVALEKTAPYAISLFSVDADALYLGRQQRDAAMQRYVECSEQNVWPGYSEAFETLSAPPWAHLP